MVGERTKMAGAHAKNILSRADQWRQARGEIVGVKEIKLLCPRQQWGCGGPENNVWATAVRPGRIGRQGTLGRRRVRDNSAELWRGEGEDMQGEAEWTDCRK